MEKEKSQRKQSIIHDLDLLIHLTKRDKAHFDLDFYTNLKKITRETVVNFKCVCGNNWNKILRNLNKSGAFCYTCTDKKATEKREATCLEKYKETHVMKVPAIQETLKATIQKLHGVDHIVQAKVVQDKIKATNQKNFGADYPLQVKEVFNRTRETHFLRTGKYNPFETQVVKEKIKIHYKKNPEKVKEISRKRQSTMLLRYKVKCPLQNKEIYKKLVNTVRRIYGTDNVMKNKSVKEKGQNTCLNKFKVKNAMQHKSVQEKGQNTLFKKHGFKYVFQIKKFKDKSKETNQKNYGCDYHSQNAEYQEKMIKKSFKTKDYTMPNNTIIKVQGYEPWALDKLFQDGIQVDDIVTNKTHVPLIWYTMDKKKHRYFCDIFVKSQNKIIEVKSDYTYSRNVDVNMGKAKTCLDKGYLFEFWVFDKNKKLEVFQVEYE
jgi:hypothetical protein